MRGRACICSVPCTRQSARRATRPTALRTSTTTGMRLAGTGVLVARVDFFVAPAFLAFVPTLAPSIPLALDLALALYLALALTLYLALYLALRLALRLVLNFGLAAEGKRDCHDSTRDNLSQVLEYQQTSRKQTTSRTTTQKKGSTFTKRRKHVQGLTCFDSRNVRAAARPHSISIATSCSARSNAVLDTHDGG